MKNYNRDNYDGGTQNWEIDQDNLGQLYFANNAGVLKFDSNKWSLFPVLNGTSVRVVKYDDESDRLYVGASNEFGYFKPRQNNGKLEYTSLINTLEDKKSDLSIIWNIEKIKGRIWFQGNFDLFCYDGNKTTKMQ